MSYDRARHERWLAGQVAMLDEVLPDPDTTCVWVDLQAHLGAETMRRLTAWSRAVDWFDRPGLELRNVDATPGGAYGHTEPVLQYIGQQLEPAVSAAAGRTLHLSHSGVKIYQHGDVLLRHRDQNRDAAYLLTWPVILDGAGDFWFHVERPVTPRRSVVETYNTVPGAYALLFASMDMWHWRGPFEGELAVGLHVRYGPDPDKVRYTSDEMRVLVAAGAAELRGKPVDDAPIRAIIHAGRERTQREYLERRPPYVLRREVFAVPERERIVGAATGRSAHPGRVYTGEGSTKGAVTAARRCTVQWLPREAATEWIWTRLARAVAAARVVLEGEPGAADYDIIGDMQMATYDVGDYFDEHRDTTHPATADRCLSVIVLLEAARLGGDLELVYNLSVDLRPGDLIVFSAAGMAHRVTPVREGRRRSLAAWFGAPTP